ncbi:metallopeptidase family protein [Pseudactinotalea sp. Z1748]|uniref:metallopeptidase family protein n=1 Tax=Pseudactinotalea sp. Z1748 TaxID=3413027 RepID=UPI003C7C3FF6
MIEMSMEQFEEAVADGLDLIPDELADLMDNVVVLVEDEPPADAGEPDLLGLYEGVPLTERGEWWAAGSLPDRITIFRNPTLRLCDNEAEVVEEVAITVVHEIAHHFGIDDERLHDLGWG